MNHTTQTPAEPARSVRGGRGAVETAPRPTRHPRRGRPAGSQLTAWAFCAPIAVYLAVFYAYPLYRNIDLSLRHYTVRSFVQGDAPFTGLANYRTIFDDPTFVPALTHTIVFTAVSLAFQYTLGLALAVFFSRRFRLSATLRALFPPPVAAA